MTNSDYEVDLQMSDIKTYEDIQRGKPVHSDGVMDSYRYSKTRGKSFARKVTRIYGPRRTSPSGNDRAYRGNKNF